MVTFFTYLKIRLKQIIMLNTKLRANYEWKLTAEVGVGWVGFI